MIVIASMLPLYRRLGMNALNLTCVTMLASGVMNMTPWGGPLARASSALKVEPNELFIPMLPAMAAGIVGVIAIALYLGSKERRRLGFSRADAAMPFAGASLSAAARQSRAASDSEAEPSIVDRALEPAIGAGAATARPKLLLVNAVLTLGLMVCVVMQLLPLPVLFMIGFALALLVNYPKIAEQRARIVAHAGNAISVVSIIFAAGVFIGVLDGTGMVAAMSTAFVSSIPHAWAPYMSPIVAVASMPFTFFISNDAFYFGVLPVVGQAGSHFGVPPIEIARASLIGQPVHILSPLVPSTYLLVGLAGVELGDHQRFTLKWAVAICLLMGAVALLSGAFLLVR
jgi:CitMHS family citrate-Mg2+:H+ or citrate-Ca2+:H+ symporter